MIILHFDNYRIEEDGRVYSLRSNKYLKPQDNGNGYLKVHLYVNGKMYQRYIHRLIAEYFIPNPYAFKYVDHIDRNKNNNNKNNIRWCSAAENTANVAGRIRYSCKRNHPKKHPLEIKACVISDFKLGLRVMELADKYKIPRQTISRFIKGH
jgi:hypothetical protein